VRRLPRSSYLLEDLDSGLFATMHKRLGLAIVICCLPGFMVSCSRTSADSEPKNIKPRIASPPTATEIFNLRSKCAGLGQKIMENNTIGSALTQDIVTHYNPETNRCYAELDGNMADWSKFDEYNSRTLYDGQTAETLAHVQRKKGQKTAYVKDGGLKSTDFDTAIIKMEELMADDRNQ
jgi:hypothetical protein